jgi:hypothetical protein
MRKVFDSVNTGDGVAAARGQQARLDVMVRNSAYPRANSPFDPRLRS